MLLWQHRKNKEDCLLVYHYPKTKPFPTDTHLAIILLLMSTLKWAWFSLIISKTAGVKTEVRQMITDVKKNTISSAEQSCSTFHIRLRLFRHFHLIFFLTPCKKKCPNQRSTAWCPTLGLLSSLRENVMLVLYRYLMTECLHSNDHTSVPNNLSSHHFVLQLSNISFIRWFCQIHSQDWLHKCLQAPGYRSERGQSRNQHRWETKIPAIVLRTKSCSGWDLETPA